MLLTGLSKLGESSKKSPGLVTGKLSIRHLEQRIIRAKLILFIKTYLLSIYKKIMLQINAIKVAVIF